ncbi:MAG: HAD-IA family hydrolase [Sulfitobacter sp.]
MSDVPRLVIFDVDGTLVDSQGLIVEAMTAAFGAVDYPVPERAAMLGVVGLSLGVLMPMLAPELSAQTHSNMVDAYKSAYSDLRATSGAAHSSPLYSGAREALDALHKMPDVVLGVATGKSRRGLDMLIEGHGLEGFFVTQQVADFHPSKPHPSMVLQAMADTGIDPAQTVMIGDTSFDMDMAAAAGVRNIGVSWGYHTRDKLLGATKLIDDFNALVPTLHNLWGTPA